ncbi:hypothetical protein EJB05_57567, partial [Eragrostis curvula]
ASRPQLRSSPLPSTPRRRSIGGVVSGEFRPLDRLVAVLRQLFTLFLALPFSFPFAFPNRGVLDAGARSDSCRSEVAFAVRLSLASVNHHKGLLLESRKVQLEVVTAKIQHAWKMH